MEIKLNLIPPSRKEEIAKSKNLRTVLRVEFFLTIIGIVFFIMLFSFEYILDFNFQSASEQRNGKIEQYEKIKRYDDRFSQINREVLDIQNIRKSQLYWSKLFVNLNETIFPGIEIKSFLNENYAINISGVSDTRSNLILFKEKLEKSDCFLNINLPLSDLIEKNNIAFQISFNVKQECLRNK